jgi:hypothetical protein
MGTVPVKRENERALPRVESGRNEISPCLHPILSVVTGLPPTQGTAFHSVRNDSVNSLSCTKLHMIASSIVAVHHTFV